MVSYCTLYYIVLFHTNNKLYHIVLYYSILYCIILYYPTLYCTRQYYATFVLYFATMLPLISNTCMVFHMFLKPVGSWVSMCPSLQNYTLCHALKHDYVFCGINAHFIYNQIQIEKNRNWCGWAQSRS